MKGQVEGGGKMGKQIKMKGQVEDGEKPPMKGQVGLPTEGPVDVPYLGNVLGEAGAVLHQQADLLHLGQGAPVEVGRAHVEVLPVNQPQLHQQCNNNNELTELGTHGMISVNASLTQRQKAMREAVSGIEKITHCRVTQQKYVGNSQYISWGHQSPRLLISKNIPD